MHCFANNIIVVCFFFFEKKIPILNLGTNLGKFAVLLSLVFVNFSFKTWKFCKFMSVNFCLKKKIKY